MVSSKLPDPIQKLVDSLEAGGGGTPGSAAALLEASTIRPGDLAAWAAFDHCGSESYGRKLVCTRPTWELMVMSWRPGDMAAIHDHGNADWGAVLLFGPAEHAVFDVSGKLLSTCDRARCESGDVLAVGGELVHQMGNVGQDSFLSLHLYGCAKETESITGGARQYDPEAEQVLRTSGGAFFDLPAEDIEGREPGPVADFPTWLRYQVELSRRVFAANDTLVLGAYRTRREVMLAEGLFARETWERLEKEVLEGSRVTAAWLRVLPIELRAVARLQQELVSAGLRSEAWSDAAVELPQLLARTDDFAAAYLDWVAGHTDLELRGLLERASAQAGVSRADC